MNSAPLFQHLHWIILLPMAASLICCFIPESRARMSAGFAIGAMALSFLLSCAALFQLVEVPHFIRHTVNVPWFELGLSVVQVGLVLDPLSALMLVMVTGVSLLVFIFSTGYMSGDPRKSRFFCFLSFFCSAMLGLVLSNSLLLTFMCWELVGLASYLLIGFWFHKPEAAAAARKAFLVTRVGDLGLLLGMVWLYRETGTLLFYDDGNGCLERKQVLYLATHFCWGGMTISTALSLLLFMGAMGKSGQFPLHIWLPDAMEGPTPVSALIHAATMVAAGVFLVARVYPLMEATDNPSGISHSLAVVAGVGAFTAVYAALIACAQWDIKRVLAYSTVSQLGYMMMALGVGGWAAGIAHLLAHAFFKALLFLGAGSVIHGNHHEQDIRKLGGLKSAMPYTFWTFAVGTMALCGVPFFFSGYWTKEAILHEAMLWTLSPLPFWMGCAGAVLTAFYMTRLFTLTFTGNGRSGHEHHPHEGGWGMRVPLLLLAAAAVLFGLLATPAWPWLEALLHGHNPKVDWHHLIEPDALMLTGISILLVATGAGCAAWIYTRIKPRQSSDETDPIEDKAPVLFDSLNNRLWLDEIYGLFVVQPLERLGNLAAWVDRSLVQGAWLLAEKLSRSLAILSKSADEIAIEDGEKTGCSGLFQSSGWFRCWQNGRVQHYLAWIAVALALLAILLILEARQ